MLSFQQILLETPHNRDLLLHELFSCSLLCSPPLRQWIKVTVITGGDNSSGGQMYG